MNLKGSTGPLSRLLSNVIIQNHPRVRVLGAPFDNIVKRCTHAHRPARARIGGKTTEGGLYDGRNEGRNYGKNELWGYFWGYL